MKDWELAHSIVLKIRSANLSKDGLERTLGVVLSMLIDGKDLEDIDPAANLILGLRQPNAIEEFLAEMKRTDENRREGVGYKHN